MTTQILTDMLAQLDGNAATPPTETPAQPVLQIELDPELADTIAQFELAKQLMSKAKKLKASSEARIREALGNAVIGTINGAPAIKVNAGTNSHTNRDLLLEAFPEAFAATDVVVDYTYLTPVK